jgi:helix-turn-helix protein
MLLGHRAGDWYDALCPPGRRSGAESVALSPDHDRGLRGGAVFLAAQRHHVHSSDAEEDGHLVHLARSRGASMANLTKADAARQLGISRTTLYKLIDQGKLSATPDGLIDTAELVRAMSTMNVHHERPRTPLYNTTLDASTSGDEHHERPVKTSSEHIEQTSSERQLTSTYRDLVDILREQLQAAQERERAYQEHITQLTTMLEQAHQQNQRLLDMPRPAPSPRPQDAPGAPHSRTRPPEYPRATGHATAAASHLSDGP